MRDQRWLFGIIAHFPFRRVAHRLHARGLGLAVDRHVAAQGRVGLGEEAACRDGEHGCKREAAERDHAGTFSVLTAHFLKSVCSEIGSVASSVTLLMSWLSSNHGTNTSPRGVLLRPRVSTRVRMYPRREATFTSSPRRTFSSAASSGCMNTTAFGNER